jgi:heme-degrading monooxygenase HmoA
MPAIVSSRYRVRPRHEAAFVALASQQMSTPAAWPDGSLQARLFQSLQDSGDFLFLSEWERQEEYGAAIPGHPTITALEGLTQSASPRGCFRLIRSIRHADCEVVAGACALMDAPAEAAGTIHAALLEQVAQLETAPGLSAIYLTHDVDTPTQYLGFAGWESDAALADCQPAQAAGHHVAPWSPGRLVHRRRAGGGRGVVLACKARGKICAAGLTAANS